MEEPDPATVRRAAAGDLDAFAELVRTTQADVWRFLRHLVDDDELAADLTQDTFVRVHRALPYFRGESRFRTWVFAIARNIAVDDRRRRHRRGRDVELTEQRTRAASDAAPPGLGLELRSALDSLPERQRSAFVLVEVFGLRYREAGEVLATSEGTVKSRVFHARAALVDWFEAAEERGHG